MVGSYIALIRKEADSDYGVDFPDLPGCVTAGSTLDEAAAMAREALALHLEGLEAEGEAWPEPSSLEDIMTLADSVGATANLVPAPKPKGRAVRINVTVDENLLKEIDSAAGPGERSGFLARAARVALHPSPLPATPLDPMAHLRQAVEPIAATSKAFDEAVARVEEYLKTNIAMAVRMEMFTKFERAAAAQMDKITKLVARIENLSAAAEDMGFRPARTRKTTAKMKTAKKKVAKKIEPKKAAGEKKTTKRRVAAKRRKGRPTPAKRRTRA